MVSVAAALGLKKLLGQNLGTATPYLLLPLAIVASALIGGIGPGLLATVLSTMVAEYFFLPPLGSIFPQTSQQAVRTLAFSAEGVGVTLLAHHLLQARREAVRRRLQTEEVRFELHRVEQRLGIATSLSPLTLSHMDRDLRFTWVENPKFRSSPDDIVGKTAEEVMGENAAAPFTAMRRRVLEHGRAERQEICLAINGQETWFDCYCEPLRSEQGEIVGVTNAAFEVTARRHIEEALRGARDEAARRAEEAEDARRLLSALLEYIPEGIGITGGPPDYRFRWISHRGVEMTGRNVSELCRSPLGGDHARDWGLFLADGVTLPRPEELPLVQAIQSGNPLHNVEMVMKRVDGRPVPILVNAAPIRDSQGTIVGGVICWRDITEIKQVEQRLEAARHQAEAASQAKDQFLAVLSHELRTPLTPVLTAAQLLEQEEDLLPEVRQMTQLIRRNVELEARLIDDLLDLTRVAQGKLAMHKMPLDVHVKLHHVVEMCRPEAQEKGLRLILRPAARQATVSADPSRLQQVIWNLLKNAIKFTSDGGIEVMTENDEAGRLVIRISDTGLGISPDMMHRLFNAFEQGGDDVTRRFGGLGLGLAITRALVEAHGGTIAASSPGIGRGSTFTVTLPTTTLPPARATPVGAPVASGARRRILLVEDHRDTSNAMTRLLRRQGYDVTVADDVASAQKRCDSETFDLIISDIGLPDGSGLDLMRSIRQRCGTPAIALSGFGMEQDIINACEAGFTAHLTKPINIAQLMTVVSHVLKNHQRSLEPKDAVPSSTAQPPHA